MAWLEDIASLITSGSLAVLNTNLFLGSHALVPTGPGPYMLILETPGYPPERLHSDDDGVCVGAAYARPGAQILTRGVNYPSVRNMANSAWALVDSKHNVTINGTFYREILALQSPFDIGPDDTKRVRLAFNVYGVKALS